MIHSALRISPWLYCINPNIVNLQVTQLLRLQVAGIHPQDVRKHCGALSFADLCPICETH